jgi:hypothetical protein
MKFLLDQNADRRFASYLRGLGHEVTVVSVDYPPGLPDADILAIAQREGRVILTNDRDFGSLSSANAGLTPESSTSVCIPPISRAKASAWRPCSRTTRAILISSSLSPSVASGSDEPRRARNGDGPRPAHA